MINGKEMIITYDFGHGATGDIGADKILNEETVVRTYGPKVIKKLEKRGFKCINCTPTDKDVKEMLRKHPYLKNSRSYIPSLKYRCDMANKYNAVVHLCFHANSYMASSHGSEVEYVSEAGKNCGTLILKEIEKLGFYNRGVRYRKDLYVLKHTKTVCVLLEPFYVCNQVDVNLYLKNIDNLAASITKGVCNCLNVPYKDKTSKYNINFCKSFQSYYNTLTKHPLIVNGVYDKPTQAGAESLMKILEDYKED